MRIEIKIDELNKEVFGFTVIGNIIILESYSFLRRENKLKRKYNSIKRYERLYKRDSTITEQEVPLTEEIKNQALQQYIDTLKVITWSEYRR